MIFCLELGRESAGRVGREIYVCGGGAHDIVYMYPTISCRCRFWFRQNPLQGQGLRIQGHRHPGQGPGERGIGFRMVDQVGRVLRAGQSGQEAAERRFAAGTRNRR